MSAAAEGDNFRIVGDLQRLHLEPGDKLVLTVPRPISTEVADRLRAQLVEALGDVQILILQDGMTLGVVNANAG